MKWLWIIGAIAAGSVIGVVTVNLTKITTYGIWAGALVVLVYACSRLAPSIR